MPKCSFCSSQLEQGTSKIVVTEKGRPLWFCSRKCEKNQLKLKRNPAHFKWTQKFATTAKKKK